jgi:hypothetical protein
MMSRSARTAARLAMVGALLAGLTACATTRLDAQWRNPQFADTMISGPVLVVGVTSDSALRHVYEDAMVSQLEARSIKAIPSYQVVSQTLHRDSSGKLLEAARRAGAATVLSSTLIDHNVARRIVVEPMPAWAWGYPGWYDWYWPSVYPGAQLRTYSRYVASTSLTDVASGKVIWLARASTQRDVSSDRELRALASTIVAALDRDGLV